MPKRQRWKPVKGTASRIYDPWERALVACFDGPLRVLATCLGHRRRLSGQACLDRDAVPRVLVLRLDRIGDLLMSLPALSDLRFALPQAKISLVVGPWSAEIARSAPIDELIIWSAPWIGRDAEGASSTWPLLKRAWALRSRRFSLAIDLQGDLRAAALMFLSGARIRVGYANTGGAYLLTDVVALDETLSWVEQNRLAVRRAIGPMPEQAMPKLFDAAERDFAQRLVSYLGLADRRPLIGIHPNGGRVIKQWAVERWRELARKLQQEYGATILVTGTADDAPLAHAIGELLSRPVVSLTGRLSVRETLAIIAELDLFISSDTGPMHMACAVGTPSVSIFGPSDPSRYFSGVSSAFPERHSVLRPDLWCSPCNLIRKPPAECLASPPPECLRLISVERVFTEAARLLQRTTRQQPLTVSDPRS